MNINGFKFCHHKKIINVNQQFQQYRVALKILGLHAFN